MCCSCSSFLKLLLVHKLLRLGTPCWCVKPSNSFSLGTGLLGSFKSSAALAVPAMLRPYMISANRVRNGQTCGRIQRHQGRGPGFELLLLHHALPQNTGFGFWQIPVTHCHTFPARVTVWQSRRGRSPLGGSPLAKHVRREGMKTHGLRLRAALAGCWNNKLFFCELKRTKQKKRTKNINKLAAAMFAIPAPPVKKGEYKPRHKGNHVLPGLPQWQK